MKKLILFISLLFVPIAGGASIASDVFHDKSRCERLLDQAREFLQRYHSRDYGSLEWAIDYASGADGEHSYNRFFGLLLDRKSLENLAAERKQAGLSSNALDFMGSALFSSEPEKFDQLIGLRYSRTAKDFPDSSRRELIVADVFGPHLWEVVDDVMQRRSIQGFDFIIARPLGALKKYTEEIRQMGKSYRRGYMLFLLHTVNQLYSRLSPHGGLLLFEVDEYLFREPGFQSWLSRLQRSGHRFQSETNRKFHFGVGYFRMALHRGEDSPQTIP